MKSPKEADEVPSSAEELDSASACRRGRLTAAAALNEGMPSTAQKIAEDCSLTLGPGAK